MLVGRRSFLRSLLAAPIVVTTANLLMPVKALALPSASYRVDHECPTILGFQEVTREALRILHSKMQFASLINGLYVGGGAGDHEWPYLPNRPALTIRVPQQHSPFQRLSG